MLKKSTNSKKIKQYSTSYSKAMKNSNKQKSSIASIIKAYISSGQNYSDRVKLDTSIKDSVYSITILDKDLKSPIGKCYFDDRVLFTLSNNRIVRNASNYMNLKTMLNLYAKIFEFLKIAFDVFSYIDGTDEYDTHKDFKVDYNDVSLRKIISDLYSVEIDAIHNKKYEASDSSMGVDSNSNIVEVSTNTSVESDSDKAISNHTLYKECNNKIVSDNITVACVRMGVDVTVISYPLLQDVVRQLIDACKDEKIIPESLTLKQLYDVTDKKFTRSFSTTRKAITRMSDRYTKSNNIARMNNRQFLQKILDIMNDLG